MENKLFKREKCPLPERSRQRSKTYTDRGKQTMDKKDNSIQDPGIFVTDLLVRVVSPCLN